MRRTPRLSLRVYLTGFFALAATAPPLVAAPFMVSAASTVIDKRAMDGLRVAGEQSGARLARGIYGPWREIEGLAALARTEGPQGLFRLRLDTAKRLDDRLSWLGVAAPNGLVIAAADGALEGKDVGDRAWFRNGLDGAYAGDVREAVLLQRILAPDPSGEPLRVLDFSKPLHRASDGALVGVIGAHVQWNAVRDLVREAVRPERADILLVSRDGTVIVGPPGVEGTRIQHLRGAAAAGQGVVATAEEDWPDGGRHLSVTMPVPGFRNMPSFGWSLILRQPTSVAHAGAKDLAGRMLPQMFAASLALLAAGLVLARILARPLESLAASAEALAQGAADAPMPEHRDYREAAVLGAALARLQSALTRTPTAPAPRPPPRPAAADRAPELAEAQP